MYQQFANTLKIFLNKYGLPTKYYAIKYDFVDNLVRAFVHLIIVIYSFRYKQFISFMNKTQ